ncbi:hypothetical protein ACWIFK_06755 [Streptomyces althioticus]|jgi:hypothetical protein|uniref:hypothetical protein n=1 Tax=Streptomyces althioticus group TaxID=2867194 RepID=UPI00178675DD|nr:hypothetical protein OG968_06510 [Streptomyces althioticus]GGQ92893.1 hypothetical protein GCM10010267_64740 [Streptomyces griseorubens]
MTQTRTTTAPATSNLLAGIVADGACKAVLGFAFLIAASRLGELLGAATWLTAVSGVALLLGGGIEMRLARKRPLRTFLRLMVAYDTGWVLTALAGYLVARQGGTAGGEVWIGYQTIAPLVFAALLLKAAPAR